MRADQIRGLMEAYSKVHETPDVTGEEVVQEVEDINEAPMTAFQAGGGQAKLDQLNKGRSPRAGRVTASQIERQGQQNLYKAGGGDAAIAKGATRSQNVRGGGSRQVSTLTRQDIINRGTVAAAKPAATPAAPKPAAAKPAATPAAPKPAAAKPAATPAAPKPAATSAASKPAGSAMDQWAKANPKLAAAKAERDRTRGTSASTNPMMKDMPGKRPAPSSPSPSTAKTGFDLAKKGVNLAADVDIFDLVKGYLLDEGYAETEEGAMVMMVNMSEEWRESILEVLGGQSGDGYIGHPRLGIKNPMSAPKKPVTSAPKNTGVAGQLGNRAAAMDAAMKQLRNSYEAEGEQLDEISTKLAGKVVNARIERTGAAADRENKARTPQNVRDTVAAADKESRAKKLAAGVRKRRSATNEQLEAWVEELTAEGYDLSGYTQEEIAEIYAQELELAEAQHARENPETHDKEEKKKYEKVRGEKTPMPPRGDKRREDFEKWYAANVR